MAQVSVVGGTSEAFGNASVQDIETSITAGGVEIAPTDLKVEDSRYDDQAALCKLTGTAQEVPAEGDRITVDLLDTRIFTGTVASVTDKTGPLVKLQAFDAVRPLQRSTMTQSYDLATIKTIAEDAFDAADVSGLTDFKGDTVIESLEGSAIGVIETTAELKGMPCNRVLTKVARWGDALWYVDEFDIVHVTADPDVGTHEIQWILDSNPSKQTLPYESVRVVGSSPASTKGRQTEHQLSSKPVVATAGSGNPTYTYQDTDIRTQQMATNAAKRILKQLQKLEKGGDIKMVGDPSIQPLDIVTLPDSMGGEQYLVSGVTHRLTETDGYTTRIECGALSG